MPTTGTVASLVSELGTGRVTARTLVEAVLRHHPEYGGGPRLDVGVRWPERARRDRIDGWLGDIASLYRSATHTPLHGRAVILGAALLDLEAGRALVECGVFWRVARELREPLPESVSDRGERQLAAIPLAATVAGRPPARFKGVHGDPTEVTGLAFTPDGELVTTQRQGNTLRWRGRFSSPVSGDDPFVGATVRMLESAVDGMPTSTPDGRRLVLGIDVLSVQEGDKRPRPLAAEHLSRATISSDGGLVAALDDKGRVRTYALDDRAEPSAPKVAFPPSARIAAGRNRIAVAADGRVWIDGNFLEHEAPVTAMAWRNDDQMLAFADAAGVVTLWHAASGEVVGEITHPGPVAALAFSPDCRTLAVGGEAGVWTSNVALPRHRRVASYDADTAAGDQDLLDIDADVEAFATLIAATTLVPPLSIGLFGNWGSGKSFFMHRLRERVREITREARMSGRVQQDLDFYKYVAQINFNAWHYVEGNLWASLVQYIFENLRVDDELDTGDALAVRRARLLKKAEADLAAAEAEVEAAVAREDASRERADVARAWHAEALRTLEQARRRDALRESVAGRVKELVSEAVEPFGFAPLTDEARDVADSFTRARRELDRLTPALRVLVDPHDRAAKKLRAQLVTIVLGGLVVSAALWFAHVAAGGAVAAVVGVLAGVGNFVRGLESWLADRRADLDRAGGPLQQEIDAARARQAEEVARREADEVRLAAELQAALNVRETARDELRRRKLEQQVPPGRLLGRLIQQRLESGDYRKHLGVLAMVRQDFSDAAEIVAEHTRWLATNEDLAAETRDDRIDRIVLYVDDLDRCPPRRVVEVLEAVHLLLAFPMFVVVVGVDPRWVLRSLQAHYWELLDPGDGEPSASPINYVEKIFQVPYQLRDMTEDTTRRMLEGLAPRLRNAPREGYAAAVPAAEPLEAGEPVPEVAGASWVAERPAPPPGRDLTPGSLHVDHAELAAMRDLAPLLGTTPRTVKRFVNLYRIVKVRAQDRPEFTQDEGPASPWRVVMLLLAVSAGLPDLAPGFFRALVESPPETRLGELNVPAEPGSEAQRSRLVAWLGRLEGQRWASVRVSAYAGHVDDVRRFSFVLDDWDGAPLTSPT